MTDIPKEFADNPWSDAGLDAYNRKMNKYDKKIEEGLKDAERKVGIIKNNTKLLVVNVAKIAKYQHEIHKLKREILDAGLDEEYIETALKTYDLIDVDKIGFIDEKNNKPYCPLCGKITEPQNNPE